MNEERIKKMKEMELHTTIRIVTKPLKKDEERMYYFITRVPNGWIYTKSAHEYPDGYGVFIPEML